MTESSTRGTVGTSAKLPGRIAGLEGLRGMGSLTIMFGHTGVHFTPAFVYGLHLQFIGQMLTFFFVASGFLLYMPYVQRLSRGRERPDTKKYYKQRFLRVFPAYIVIFVVVNFIFQTAYIVNPFTVSWDSELAGAGMITNPLHLLAQFTLTQTYFPATFQTGINPSWSLSTEFGFYLVLPLLAMALFHYAKKSSDPLRLAVLPPVFLIGLGLTMNTLLWYLQKKYYGANIIEGYWGSNWIAVLARSFPALADAFGFGMLAAVIYVAISRGMFEKISTYRLQWTFGGMALFGLAVSTALFLIWPRYLPTAFAFTTASFILLIVAPQARGEHSAIAVVTDWRPLKYVGIISLSAYLWHYPLLLVMDRLGIDIAPNGTGLLIAFAISGGGAVALASLSYKFVERPALNRGG